MQPSKATTQTKCKKWAQERKASVGTTRGQGRISVGTGAPTNLRQGGRTGEIDKEGARDDESLREILNRLSRHNRKGKKTEMQIISALSRRANRGFGY